MENLTIIVSIVSGVLAVLAEIIPPAWFKTAGPQKKRVYMIVSVVTATAAVLALGCGGLIPAVGCVSTENWLGVIWAVVAGLVVNQTAHQLNPARE